MDLSERSPVQNFYKNANIFITGATGFLGTALLEKLIRSCPDINTIYILMREKKNKSTEQRFEEIFDNHLWDTVREQNPNYKNNVKIVNGDLTTSKLGLSDEDCNELCKQVNIIFHVAATVRFDEPLKQAAKINIEATKMTLELASKCKNLKSFVHVSTAYSQCDKPTLKEIFYTPPRDPEEFLTFCEQHTQEELDAQLSDILGRYPNTYTFTKGIAENLIQKYENELPLAICRPSIVFGSAEGPIKGWFKGVSGAVGTMIGVGTGVLHVLPANSDAIIDAIPVDMCVSLMIAAAFETAKQSNRNKVFIYNSVTGSENPLTWGKFFHWSVNFANAYTCVQSIWLYFLLHPSNKILARIYQILFHIIPGFILDSLLKLNGKDPKLLKIYDKVHHMTDLLFVFCTTSWLFYNETTRQLYENLDSRDQKLFCFDVRKIEWDLYLIHVLRHARVHLLKEPFDNMLVASKKMSRFKIAHYSLVYIFVTLFIWFLYVVSKLFI